jgi:hypothetical protein
MKMPTKQSSTKKPVEVSIAVTKFRDVLADETPRGGRDTEYAMKLRKRDPRAYIKGDNIYVLRPGTTLRFTLALAADRKETFYPAGITFVREGERTNSDRLRLGLINFPQSLTRLDGRTLSITDSYRDRARGVRYKFSILVQRGSDGKMGIIDPGIVHELD